VDTANTNSLDRHIMSAVMLFSVLPQRRIENLQSGITQVHWRMSSM
jgi:hypothetical protein